MQIPHGSPRSGERGRARRREAGSALVTLLVVLALLGAGLFLTLSFSAHAKLAGHYSRLYQAGANAARQVLNSPAAAASPAGGSVAPDAPVEGYTDVVLFDRAAGTYAPFAPGTAAGSNQLVFRRQWRVSRPAGMSELVLSVSAELLDNTGTAPASGRQSVLVKLPPRPLGRS